MTYDETLMLMAIMKAAYPEYYRGMKKGDADGIVALWTEMLKPYPYELCDFAVKRLISESKYVPKISEVVERVKECLDPAGDGAVDAWTALSRAASRASAVTREQYNALPYEVQRFCGGLSGLVDLGNLDAEIFNTVTRGQFMKAYDGLKRSRETLELMPPEVLALVRSVSKPKLKQAVVKRLPEPEPEFVPSEPIPYKQAEDKTSSLLTADEWNTRRNEFAATLDRMAGSS